MPEIEKRLSLEEEIKQSAQTNPKALAAALSDMIKTTKEELTMAHEELDKALDNLKAMDREVTQAIETGKEVPWNYEESRHELLENIREQQVKINDLQPRLDEMYDQQHVYTKNAIKESAQAFKEGAVQIGQNALTSAKEMLQTVKDTFVQISATVAEKNEQFRSGVKEAMKDVGDKAQEIYVKGAEKVQSLAKGFREKVEEIAKAGKELGENMLDKAKGAINKGVEAVQTKAAAAREDMSEVRSVNKTFNLEDKLANAQAFRTKMENNPSVGKSVLLTGIYNMALDHEKKVTGQLRDFLKGETDRLDARVMNGKYINPNHRNFITEMKQKLDDLAKNIAGEKPKTIEVKGLDR